MTPPSPPPPLPHIPPWPSENERTYSARGIYTRMYHSGGQEVWAQLRGMATTLVPATAVGDAGDTMALLQQNGSVFNQIDYVAPFFGMMDRLYWITGGLAATFMREIALGTYYPDILDFVATNVYENAVFTYNNDDDKYESTGKVFYNVAQYSTITRNPSSNSDAGQMPFNPTIELFNSQCFAGYNPTNNSGVGSIGRGAGTSGVFCAWLDYPALFDRQCQQVGSYLCNEAWYCSSTLAESLQQTFGASIASSNPLGSILWPLHVCGIPLTTRAFKWPTASTTRGRWRWCPTASACWSLLSQTRISTVQATAGMQRRALVPRRCRASIRPAAFSSVARKIATPSGLRNSAALVAVRMIFLTLMSQLAPWTLTTTLSMSAMTMTTPPCRRRGPTIHGKNCEQKCAPHGISTPPSWLAISHFQSHTPSPPLSGFAPCRVTASPTLHSRIPGFPPSQAPTPQTGPVGCITPPAIR